MQGSDQFISFEVSRYRNGRWELDSTYDDRELALDVARQLRQGGRFLGVRVVKEWLDDATGMLKSRVILNDVEIKREPEQKWVAQDEAPARPKPSAERLPQRRPPSPRRSRLEEPIYLLLTFGALLLLGIAAIIGLRELASMV